MKDSFNSKRIAATICGVIMLAMGVATNVASVKTRKQMDENFNRHTPDNWIDIYYDDPEYRKNQNPNDIINDYLDSLEQNIAL